MIVDLLRGRIEPEGSISGYIMSEFLQAHRVLSNLQRFIVRRAFRNESGFRGEGFSHGEIRFGIGDGEPIFHSPRTVGIGRDPSAILLGDGKVGTEEENIKTLECVTAPIE